MCFCGLSPFAIGVSLAATTALLLGAGHVLADARAGVSPAETPCSLNLWLVALGVVVLLLVTCMPPYDKSARCVRAPWGVPMTRALLGIWLAWVIFGTVLLAIKPADVCSTAVHAGAIIAVTISYVLLLFVACSLVNTTPPGSGAGAPDAGAAVDVESGVPQPQSVPGGLPHASGLPPQSASVATVPARAAPQYRLNTRSARRPIMSSPGRGLATSGTISWTLERSARAPLDASLPGQVAGFISNLTAGADASPLAYKQK
jgi:hypothetical protein